MGQFTQFYAKHGAKIALMAVFLAALLFASSFFASNYLAFAEGDSMLPTFRDCTLLVVNKEARPEALMVGEIAVVDITEQSTDFDLIAHRVVENLPNQQKFSTRGDNSAYYAFPSSIDGYFGYAKFGGKVDAYYILPEVICN